MDLSQEERQKFLELIDKVSPCAAISEKENLEKFKEWLDSDRSKRVTFVEAPKIFKDQVGNDKEWQGYKANKSNIRRRITIWKLCMRSKKEAFPVDFI